MILLIVYELILILIRLIKTGLGGTLAAWPLYLGVLIGSQLARLEGWARYFAEEMFGIRETGGIGGIGEFRKAAGRALEKLRNSGLQDKLLVRNVLFMPMWLALAIFAFTSTSGWFPKGAILGMGLQWFIKPRNEKLLIVGYGAVFCLASFLI